MVTPAGQTHVYVPAVVYSVKHTFTARVNAALLSQPSLAITLILPEPDETNATVTEVLPCPDVIISPAGKDHIYEVAPESELFKYSFPAGIEIQVFPVIAPGVGRPEFIVTDIVLLVLVPQEFPADTLILPDMLPNVTVIDVVPCPLLINAPEGKLQE